MPNVWLQVQPPAHAYARTRAPLHTRVCVRGEEDSARVPVADVGR